MIMAQFIDKDAVAEIKDLYEDIDKCIGDLLLARSKHDQRGISDAHWKMETMMVNTQQVLSYILQHLEVKEVDLELNSFDATVCKIGSTYLKEMDKDAIIKALEPYKDGDKVKVIIKAQKGKDV